jgi:DNA-binding transcriptional MerR regulator
VSPSAPRRAARQRSGTVAATTGAAAASPATTGAVAAMLGVHPNTLRWYESAGYLPPVPRTPGGYRQFSVELVRLARIVRESQPLLRLYGPIRTTTFAFLTTCREECVVAEQAPGRHRRARRCLSGLARLLQEEHRLALDALDALERFRRGAGGEGAESPGSVFDNAYPCRGRLQYIGAAAALTSLSRDRIINWERNGLGRYPRSTAGYRLFGAEELDRLLIIRSCRTAGYSITAIRRLLRAVTPSGDLPPAEADTPPLSEDVSLRTIADTPTPHETRLFTLFPTDTLPATLEAMIALTARLRALLER